MRIRFFVALIMVVGFASFVWCQSDAKTGRNAERGPAAYDSGPMLYEFKGLVTAADDEKREITLTEVKKDPAKAKIFVGVLSKSLMGQAPDGKQFELKPSDFMGATITVFYQSRRSKDQQGKDIKINFISNFKMHAPPPAKS